jgi:hypothetical protein
MAAENGMRRLGRLVAPALLVAVLTACTGTNPETSAIPAKTAIPSVAADPTIVTTIAPSPSASATPMPAASPSPGSDLADVLPDFAGPHRLEKQAMGLEELQRNGDPVGFARMLRALGLDSDELEIAAGSASGSTSAIGLLALRADGISGDDLADAFVAAAMASLPDRTLTTVETEGVTLRRIEARIEDDVGIFTVLPIGDALIVGVAEPEDDELVQRTLIAMLEPSLEQLLPTSLDGRPLEAFVMPGEAFPASGGDVCAIVCPGELQAMAAELDADIRDVRLAFGQLQGSPELAILAFEFPGAPTEDLMALREKLGVYDSSYERTELTVDGKRVLRFRDTSRDDPVIEQWLYANDGVLYLIYVEHVDEGTPSIVEDALAALP